MQHVVRHLSPGPGSRPRPGGFAPTGVGPLAGLALVVLVAGAPAVGAPAPTGVDPLLTEAVRWYTGVAGRMDDDRAAALLERARADGDPLSVMWHARVHSTGRMGFPEDPARARALAATVIDRVEALAADGNAEAQFLMGTARAEGLGRSPDAGRAVVWYRRAAAQGHALAIHNLGNAHAEGRGVPPDPAAAVRWWRMASRAGDAVTQYRLGEALERGLGVPRDRAQALRWYRASAARGYPRARVAAERLADEGP